MGLLNQGQYKTVWFGHSNIYTCVKSRKKLMVILKLDFKKAFDTLEHEAIIQI